MNKTLAYIAIGLLFLAWRISLGDSPSVPTVDAPRGLHIRLGGKIDATMERTALALFMLTATYPPNQDIIVDIDSPGGSLLEAYRIMGALDALVFSSPNNVICVGHSKVSSAAVTIFQACSLRLLHDTSEMFLHLPKMAIFDGSGKEVFSSPEWLIERYAASLGLTPKAFRALLTGPNNTRTLSAREAVRLGLADAIIYNPNKKEERNAKN